MALGPVAIFINKYRNIVIYQLTDIASGHIIFIASMEV